MDPPLLGPPQWCLQLQTLQTDQEWWCWGKLTLGEGGDNGWSSRGATARWGDLEWGMACLEDRWWYWMKREFGASIYTILNWMNFGCIFLFWFDELTVSERGGLSYHPSVFWSALNLNSLSLTVIYGTIYVKKNCTYLILVNLGGRANFICISNRHIHIYVCNIRRY